MYDENSSVEERKKRIETMNRLAVHRGPDYTGTYHDGVLSMGHNRLSIIDTDSRSHQPFIVGDYVLIFNGCIYNYRELRDELRRYGHRFETDSDTEVLLKAYIQWKGTCLDRLNGMWAFILYDKKRKEIFAARDRYGVKPFYFIRRAGFLAVASEIKQLLPFAEAYIDDEAAYAYFNRGIVDYSEKTLYKEVEMLRPSEKFHWHIGADDIDIQRYYHIPMEKDRVEEDEIEALIQSSISLRRRADVPLGLTLSSGLDSNIIAYHLGKGEKENIHAYSSAFPGYECDESVLAGKSAEELGLNFHTQTASWEKMKKQIGQLSYMHDMPLTGYATYASYCLQKRISTDGIKVILNGQGSDEIFGGYDTYFLKYLYRLLKTNPLGAIAEFYYGFKLNQYDVRSLFYRGWNYVYGKQREWISTDMKLIVPTEDYGGLPFLGRLGAQALFSYALGNMLHSVDRNSMSNGIESRTPFLDYRIVERALCIANSRKINMGLRKKILRDIYRDKLPQHVLSKLKKQGYSSPQSILLKRDMKNILNEIRELKAYLPEWIDDKELMESGELREDMQLLWRVWTWVRWREYSSAQYDSTHITQ